jgi:YHS domain-containing protein
MATSKNHKLFIDPVCGMQVDPATAAARTCYNGIQIYFCAEACKTAFEAEPQSYTLRDSGAGTWIVWERPLEAGRRLAIRRP